MKPAPPVTRKVFVIALTPLSTIILLGRYGANRDRSSGPALTQGFREGQIQQRFAAPARILRMNSRRRSLDTSPLLPPVCLKLSLKEPGETIRLLASQCYI